MERYEIKTGKFGQYFFDKEAGCDMPLQAIVTILNTRALQNSNPVLDLTFEALDINKTLSIKGYLKELMIQLIVEQEGFSGKRPFGESGWAHGMEKAMVENGLIEGELDGDGFLRRSDSNGFVKRMISGIRLL